MKEISLFSFPNLFWEENFPKNWSNSWITFCKQKIPEKTFWIYDFLGVLLYLKFPWGRKWSRRCPEGSRKYNFSQLRWDELRVGAQRGRHRRRKVSDKWGPHELWRKLQMINFKVETLGPGFSCLGRTGTGAVSFSSPDDVLFGSLKGGFGNFLPCFCAASGKWKIICERKFSWWDTKLWLHELVCVFTKMLSRKCTLESPSSEVGHRVDLLRTDC